MNETEIIIKPNVNQNLFYINIKRHDDGLQIIIIMITLGITHTDETQKYVMRCGQMVGLWIGNREIV